MVEKLRSGFRPGDRERRWRCTRLGVLWALAFACRKSWWLTQDGDQAKRLGITLVLVGQVAVDVGRDLVS